MRVIRKFGLLSLVFILTLLTQSAFATLTDLPDTTYLYLSEKAQGTSYFYGADLHGYIDFAVYDTSVGNEFVDVGGFTAPGAGQYIYAYQIFCSALSIKNLTSFQILNEDGITQIDPSVIDGISAQDPGTGKAPSGTETKGIWKFTGASLIAPTEHSWLLVFSSDNAPVPGDYIITPESDDFWVADDSGVPEPSMIALLGFGATAMLRKRRKNLSIDTSRALHD